MDSQQLFQITANRVANSKVRLEMLLNPRLTAGVVGLLLLVVASAIAADQKPGEKWAVLVGVDDYAYAKDLQFCGADMRSLKTELLASGFEERQVILLDDEAKDKRLQPYRSNIEKQIELVCANAEKGDFVLLAFSGHGVLLEKTSFLCPTDAKLDDAKTLISLDWVYQQLQRSQADLRLVLVDACRNVPAELSGKRSFSATELKDSTRAFVKDAERLPEGVLLLNSCSEGEFAQEDKEFGHGVFMHFLLEGLRGKADGDGDKSVTLNELFRFTSKETKLYVSTKFADSQRPKLKGNLTVEVLDYQVATIGSREQKRSTPPTTPINTEALRTSNEKTITSRSTGMKLTLIPAGNFKMGSPSTEEGHFSNELPQHEVQISQPFYMGVFEVTQGEFETVMGRNPSWFSKSNEGRATLSGQSTTRFPVESVTWYDAIEFCNRLSEKDGLSASYNLTNVKRKGDYIESASVTPTGGTGYHLPTEAEWEYACRGKTTTAFNAGREMNVKMANIDGHPLEGFESKGQGLGRTTTVGSYAPNRFGLYDMHGNVEEWCYDFFEPKAYKSSIGTEKDPVYLSGTDGFQHHVLRGGAWYHESSLTRSAMRNGPMQVDPSSFFGFRVVRQ